MGDSTAATSSRQKTLLVQLRGLQESLQSTGGKH